MTNKQELREAAEKATQGKWRRASTRFNGITATPFSLGGEEVILAGASEKRDAEFIAAANPSAVLALLDELEFLDKRNAELNSTLERWAVDRAQSASELDDAEKRIAELEAREVTLPKVQDIHPLGPQSERVLCEFHRNIVNRCADEIRKVGVKVSIKGD